MENDDEDLLLGKDDGNDALILHDIDVEEEPGMQVDNPLEVERSMYKVGTCRSSTSTTSKMSTPSKNVYNVENFYYVRTHRRRKPGCCENNEHVSASRKIYKNVKRWRACLVDHTQETS
jgi:hypothetical protein